MSKFSAKFAPNGKILTCSFLVINKTLTNMLASSYSSSSLLTSVNNIFVLPDGQSEIQQPVSNNAVYLRNRPVSTAMAAGTSFKQNRFYGFGLPFEVVAKKP